MNPNFSDMYNSLTPTPNTSASLPPLPPPPPPPFVASGLPKDPPPLPPPLVVSKSAPLIRDCGTPALSFDPSPDSLPPVFVSSSFDRDSSDHFLLSEAPSSTSKPPPEGLFWVSGRPRAYTEGSHPSSLFFSRLCKKLAQSQKEKSHLLQSILYLENYILCQPQDEKNFDLAMHDKCLDNAIRKLKRKRVLLDNIKHQIGKLEAQVPSEQGFPIYYPLPTPSVQNTNNTRDSIKTPKFFKNLKKRAKTWPFS